MIAHHGAAWTGAAYAGKLKAFAEYRKPQQAEPQSSDQILETLQALQEMGAPMTIEQIN